MTVIRETKETLIVAVTVGVSVIVKSRNAAISEALAYCLTNLIKKDSCVVPPRVRSSLKTRSYEAIEAGRVIVQVCPTVECVPDPVATTVFKSKSNADQVKVATCVPSVYVTPIASPSEI